MPRHADEELQSLREQHLYRQLRPIDLRQENTLSIDEKTYINFSSNDYLGLSHHPRVLEVYQNALTQWGVGSGSSRLICGTLRPHLQLEQRLAELKKSEASLTFSSGYAAAIGSITALTKKGDILILDKLCHASLIDGARLSGATLRIYPHNDTKKLESHLQWAQKRIATDGQILVITESVFSMDGDLCPLEKIVELKEKYEALLLLDEAHALGIIGDGLGLADQLGLCQQVDLQMGTLSKALGLSGGYLCASRANIDLLINRSRSFIYSTAPSAAIACAALCALDLLTQPEGKKLRQQLRRNVQQLSSSISQIKPSPSAILPLIIGSSEKALALSSHLQEKGLLTPAIRYPTVPRDKARLRITLSATHTSQQIEQLIQSLRLSLADGK